MIHSLTIPLRKWSQRHNITHPSAVRQIENALPSGLKNDSKRTLTQKAISFNAAVNCDWIGVLSVSWKTVATVATSKIYKLFVLLQSETFDSIFFMFFDLP